MLIEFSLENFRSFRDRQTLSMVASRDSELRDKNTFPFPGKRHRLITSAAIYGPNASGKSNLILGFETLKRMVRNSAERMQKDDEIPVQPFKLDSRTRERPSRFEVVFSSEGVQFEYGVELDSRVIHGESLVAYPRGKPQLWYSRTRQDSKNEKWYFGPNLKGERDRIKGFVRNNSLFLSHAAQNNHEQLSKVYNWFAHGLKGIDPSIMSYTQQRCANDKEFRNSVLDFLKAADTAISDLVLHEKTLDEDFFPTDLPKKIRDAVLEDLKGSPYYEVSTGHSVLGSNHLEYFPLGEESQGTQRLFTLAGPFLEVLRNGDIFVVDELAESLHHHITTFLISLFHNPEINKNHAQLVFTTHNVTLFEQNNIRRDQFWFTEKAAEGNTNLYPLSDFSPRKDESLQKGYLRGRYGAVPYPRQLNLL